MSNKPSFLGIGAQKAGTTWIHKRLEIHPELYLPPEKEIHYWDLQYKEHDLAWYESLFARAEGAKIKGEITPAYSILDMDKIDEIYDYNPDMKVFFSMRNPIDRAWSAALMELKRAGLEFDQTSDQWFIKNFMSEGSLARGNYVATFENWLSIFDHHNLMVLFFEDICKNPRITLQNICTHIGADPTFYDNIDEDKLGVAEHQNETQAIRPSLEKVLCEIYFPIIDELSEFLQFDLSHWKKS